MRNGIFAQFQITSPRMPMGKTRAEKPDTHLLNLGIEVNITGRCTN